MGEITAREIIRIEGLSKRFGEGENSVLALDDISLDVHEGEIIGIIGLSGAGKSTLVRCINYLEKPTAGSVKIDGRDIGSLSEKDLRVTRRSIGMIFQQHNLLMQRTALENIRFPLTVAGEKKSQAILRARELLQIVGLTDKENAYPSQLSGGQRQRVAIARALANNPKVLLCDEATSALDPTTTRSILALLKEINQRMNLTIVVITHEMSVVQEICARVAIIDDSRIVESGSVEEIFKHPKTAAARRLLYPGGNIDTAPIGQRLLRIVFDGNASYEPIIANMVISCGAAVNILFADTKTIDNKVFGQMIVQLPADTQIAQRMLYYLDGIGVHYEEDVNDV